MVDPSPSHERARLETLRSYELLDTEHEEPFDRIVRIAAATCRCPISLMSLVDDHRQWFKAAFGVDVRETVRDAAFCAHAVERGETLVVDDAVRDPRFTENPLVLSSPNIRFYAGVPVRAANGMPLGTLCVIDRSPRKLEAVQLEALTALASEVEVQIELRRALRQLRGAKLDRDRLSALLVHDLRNPLTAVVGAMQGLRADPGLPRSARESVEVALAAAEAANRMLVNVLDLARADAGKLTPMLAEVDLRALFEAIVRSARAAASATRHEVEASLDVPAARVRTDGALVRRIVENLLDNAFKYAPPATHVRIEARGAAGRLAVRVLDEGPGVPPEMREAVFAMHTRLDGDTPAPRASYGFGLTSCRVAVDALGGRIWIEPASPRGAAFCFEIPLA